jgi:lysozyme
VLIAEKATQTLIYQQANNKENVNLFLSFFKQKFSKSPAPTSREEILKLEALVLAGIVVTDFEEYRNVAYHATADERRRNIFTVGFGETQGVGPGDRMSYAEACFHLKDRIGGMIDQLKGWKPDLFQTFTAAQIAALASLLYNVGEGNFKGGATFQAFLAGDVRGIMEHGFDREKGFVKQSGKILNGLVDRREKESTLLLTTTIISSNKKD